jgi:superfamily II DNA or RNA helicase
VTLASSLDPAPSLRAWQRRALVTYLTTRPTDFLAVATPGAGKTTFALKVAAELLADHTVQAVTVVTPTEHLKSQWAQAAAAMGIALDPAFSNAVAKTSRDFTGVAVTYAQVAAHPMLHRARTEARRTLVILDEIHHAGDAKSWGDAVREAFQPAARRLALTGTPFRSDTNPIPFVSYAPGSDGIMRSSADHSYGYADALRDRVVRPVLFLAYSGEMRWRTSAGDEVAATLGEQLTPDAVAHAWRTALDPKGEWIPTVLAAADQRLTAKRREMPDAAGLVIASDHATARAYAALLKRITGEAPTVVLSDEPRASRKIAEFGASNARWLVAVRMVSEGVDVPRLAVGVYATSVSTPLFFAQAVGRFVRARSARETASVFLPSVPTLMALAAEMEIERDHALQRPLRDGEWDDDLLAAANRTQTSPDLDDGPGFEALGASAHLDRVIFDGADYGSAAAPGTPEEEDFLGLPGLLEPEQVATLLQRRQAEQQKVLRSRGVAAPAALTPAEELAALRRELNGIVNARSMRTGHTQAMIHAELRRACGGPPTAEASIEQLRSRVAYLRAAPAR